jgi:hypothetical protein
MPPLDLTAIIVASITGLLALAAAGKASRVGRSAGRAASNEQPEAQQRCATKADLRGLHDDILDRMDRLERISRAGWCEFTPAALARRAVPGPLEHDVPAIDGESRS